ncbi:protein kinase domain-containing protein [Gemmata sp.]|uniref:protein kinase domain-containing protein n=1 Tax=Gemmata sp. TaxID=1914242 RepID=UPI003F6E5CFF
MPEPPADNPLSRPAPGPPGKSVLSDSTCTHGGGDGAGPDRPPVFRPPVRPGDLGRLGRYRVLKQLGKGGMGWVYLGFDEVLQRKLAIKVLTPRFAANTVARERFLREARTAASVSSPHVVAILDVDEDVGNPFIAMEYLQGLPLDRYLATHPRLNVRQVLRIGQEVARGLAAAHAAGLVHRDIKPANLWLEAPKGRVKILDFGLAKEAVRQGGADVTLDGQLVGTPAFMSPEQARGEPVDARTDLFCLGIVLYRLCTGEQPFVGPNAMAVVLSVGIDEPAPVRQLNPDVPESLAGLIYQLLRKKPAERPRSASDVHAALVAIEEGKGPAAPQAWAGGSDDAAPIAVAAQGDAVWEQFDTVRAAGETTAVGEETQRKAAARDRFPWRLVAGVFAALFAAVALVAGLQYASPAPPPRDAEPEPLVRPPAKADPERRFAEWALNLPAAATIEIVGGPTVTQAKALPATPFKVRRVHVSAEYAVTDADLNLLQPLTGLEAVSFARTVVTGAGIEKLSHYVSAPYLIELSLGTEDVTDEALRWYGAFKSLQVVALTGPHVTREGVRVLQAHCPNLTHLALDRVELHNTDLAPFGLLRWFPKLEHLGVSCPPVAPLGLGWLATWPGLKSLHLSGTGLGDADLDLVARTPGLPALALRRTAVTDAGLPKLARLAALKRLTITESPGVTTAGIAQLKGLLPNCAVEFDAYVPKNDPDRLAAEWALSRPRALVGVMGAAGPVATVEKLPRGPVRVTAIDLTGTAHVVHDADLDRIVPLAGLTAVKLGRTRITDAGLKKWSEAPGAARYAALAVHSPDLTGPGLAALKGFPALTALELAGPRITDAGMRHVAALPALAVLDLDRTAVTDEGLLALTALKGLRSLSVKETRVTAAGLRRFSAALPACKVRSDFGLGALAPLDPAWAAAVAKMPPAKQVEAVAGELVRRNPKFDGKVTPVVAAAGVVGLRISSEAVADIAPVAALPKLAEFHCTGDERGAGALTDVAPLAGLPLLRDVSLARNRNLVDLSPLAGKPLTALNLSFTGVADLGVVAGMPLKTLAINPLPIKDFAPLLKCPALADLSLDFGLAGVVPAPQIEAVRPHPGLKTVEGIPVAVFWPAWDRRKDPAKLAGPQRVIATGTRDVRSLAFDADGKRLATFGYEGKLQVWDARTGDRLHVFDAKAHDLKGFGQTAEFVPGTDLLAAGYTDGLRFWNLKSQKPDGERLPPFEQFCGLAVSPDGKTVTGHSSTGKVPVARYAVATRQPLAALEGHTGGAHLAAFSPDSKHLVTASMWPDGSVRVWDLAAGREAFRADRPWLDTVVGVGFTPDNRLAVFASARSVVEVIDWKAKTVERSLRWFPAGGAALAPGGTHVVLGGASGVVTVLDLATGAPVAEVNGGTRVVKVAVAPDGKTIATGHSDGTVRLWDWAALRGK